MKLRFGGGNKYAIGYALVVKHDYSLKDQDQNSCCNVNALLSGLYLNWKDSALIRLK
jgi:hypothetical protein